MAVLSLSPVLTACGPRSTLDKESAYEQQMAILTSRGIVGEHPLLDLGSLRGRRMEGLYGGSFLGFSGNISGGDISKVQFAWATATDDPITVITEVPTTKALFRVRDGVTRPTVNFDLNLDTLVVRQASYERYAVVDSENPNDFLAPSFLGHVRFTLSPEQFQKIPNNLQK